MAVLFRYHKIGAIIAFSWLFACHALAQTYPSPHFQDLTVDGALHGNAFSNLGGGSTPGPVGPQGPAGPVGPQGPPGSGGGGGGVSSVGLTVPSWLAVTGSPITTSGIFSITTIGQVQNLFLASPSGGFGVMSPRAITAVDISAALASPQSIGSTTPGLGVFSPLTATGNFQVIGGALTNVDLQTAPPANGSFISNAGASFQNCPLIGCLAGAHEFSGVYFKYTAQFDATKAEYMVTFDSDLNSGKSPQWVTGTVYGANSFVDNAGNIYKTTAGGTAGATAPTCTSGSCSDGAVTWVFQVSNFAASKVGFFNSATTGSSSSYASWGMANVFTVGAGDTGFFKVGAELDITNNSTDCAIGVKACYGVYLTGLTNNPVTAYFGISTTANNTSFGSHFAELISGLKIADTADLEIDDTAPIAIGVSTLIPGTAHTYAFKDLSTATVGAAYSGSYSYSAIQTDGMTGTVAMTVKSGVGICMNGTTDCFSWDATSGAINFGAQAVRLQQIANGSVATVLGSVGPVGSHTTVQEWFQIKDAAGNIRYVPGF